MARIRFEGVGNACRASFNKGWQDIEEADFEKLQAMKYENGDPAQQCVTSGCAIVAENDTALPTCEQPAKICSSLSTDGAPDGVSECSATDLGLKKSKPSGLASLKGPCKVDTVEGPDGDTYKCSSQYTPCSARSEETGVTGSKCKSVLTGTYAFCQPESGDDAQKVCNGLDFTCDILSADDKTCGYVEGQEEPAAFPEGVDGTKVCTYVPAGEGECTGTFAPASEN